MELYNLFSVPVLRYSADESYDNIQCEIQKAIKNYDGFKRSYNFIEKYNCQLLKKRIEESCLSYLKYSRWSGMYDKSKSPIKLENSWINFGKKGESHIQHVHPGHKISGVYYYRVNRKQGSIIFQNPNPISNTCEFPSGQTFSSFTEFVLYDGDIILFPSWLSHGTTKSRSDEERVSIAFNIDLINLNTNMINGLMKGSHIQTTAVEVSIHSEIKLNGL